MPVRLEPYLAEKREEMIWALSDPETQGYSMAQIARIFNDMPKSTIQSIIERKPADYKTKWVKK